LRDIGTLVRVSTRAWQAKVNDRKAGSDLKAAKHAKAYDAVEVRKYLLAGAGAEHKALLAAIRKIYNEGRRRTLSWGDSKDGWRLLLNAKFFDFVQSLGQLQKEMGTLRDAFRDTYELRRQAAMATGLGELADPSLYPDVSKLDALFGVTVEFQPIPHDSGFGETLTAYKDALRANLNKLVSKRLESAVSDGWGRLLKYVQNMATTLKDEERNRFHETLVSNIKDMVEILKAFDVTDDPRYAELVKAVEEELCQVPSKGLKLNVTKRREVAQSANALLKKFAEMGITPVDEDEED
jgi:hypothetical protein